MPLRRKTVLEQASDFGKIYRDDRFVCDVVYDVTVYQHWIETRAGEPPIQGMKEIVGRITSPDNPMGLLDLIGESLTLHLKDGRRWDMIIKNSDGVAVNRGQGLYSPE